MAIADINNVNLTGRVTRDTELKSSNSGYYCRFSIAVNRRVKKGDNYEDEASYFDCVLWGKQAENLAKYLTKGRQITLSGELRQTRWTKDGQTQSRIDVYPSSIVLGNESSKINNGSQTQQQKPQTSSNESTGSDRNWDDDVPF